MKKVNKYKCKPILLSQLGLVCIFIFCARSGFCQSLPGHEIDSLIEAARTKGLSDIEIADSIYDAASVRITELGIDQYPASWVRLLHERAWTCLFHGLASKAKRHLSDAHAAVNNYMPLLGDRFDSLRAQTQLIEANYFYVISGYGNALLKLDSAETYWRARNKEVAGCISLYQIFQFQASIYYLQGEYESCIDRHLGSIKYFDCFRSKLAYPNYILVHRNISLAYSKKGDTVNARRYLMSAKQNLDTCPEQSRDFIIRTHALLLYNSLGELYRMENKLDSARYYYNQAGSVHINNPTFATRISDGLAKIALAEKKYQYALQLFQRSLTQSIQVRGNKHYLSANAYRSIAGLHLVEKHFDKALSNIQKALNSLAPAEELDTLDYQANPALSYLYMPKDVLMTLHQKAGILSQYYTFTKATKYLVAARTTNNLALQLLDSTRNEFSLEKDKVVLGEDAVKVYQTGLQIANELYRQTNDQRYLRECFDLIDKSKSAVLMDHIKLVKNFGGIPSRLVDRERELKVELSVAEQQLYTAEIKKEETSIHRQHLGEIKKAYAALLNDIKVSAPNYYKLRIENKQLTLPEAQSMLQPQELLVEYFFSDSILYAMAVTPTTAELHTVAIDSLRSHVETLRDMLARPGNLADAPHQAKWNSICKAVSMKVVAPWEKHLKSAKRIIVVPHDVLNYLPLEMLSESGTPLVNSVSISYASSAALLREQKQMTPTGNFFAAFNADYSNQPHLPQLAGAAREVSSIESIFGFRSTRFASATADDFRKKAANFKIIHLALHSLINDEKPMFSRLVFTRTGDDTNADITANELYSMQLNAEIAVLSACETGLGKLQRGEGMMSLSRAFMYAGVPSTVISLWKVPDQSASILMTKFYQFLKDGHLKDEALQLAKLEFIKEHPEMSHPFFWAGFIINGKTDPLSFDYFSTRELFAIVILGLGLLLASSVVILKKRRSVKSISLTH